MGNPNKLLTLLSRESEALLSDTIPIAGINRMFIAGESSLDSGGEAADDGEAVRTWRDIIGGSASMTWSVGSQNPTLDRVAERLNRRSSLLFDGAGDVLISSQLSTTWQHTYDGTGGTLWLVVDDRDVGSLGVLCATGNFALGTVRGIFFARFGTDLVLRLGNGSGTLMVNQVIEDVAKGPAIYKLTMGATSVQIHRNGREILDVAYVGTPQSGAPFSNMAIGASDQFNTNPLLGGIAFFADATSVVTSTDVEEALSAHYDIPIAFEGSDLPSTQQFVVEGQSNAEAYAGVGGGGEVDDVLDTPFCVAWDANDGAWRNGWSDGFCGTTNGIGQWMAKLASIRAGSGRRTAVVGLASGGKALSYFQKGQPHYTTLQAKIAASGIDAANCTWFLFQGEADGGISESARRTALETWRSDRRSDFGTGIRFVIFQIATNACSQDMTGVRAANVAFAAAHADVTLVNLDDIYGDPIFHDGCHMTDNGYSVVGVRAEAAAA